MLSITSGSLQGLGFPNIAIAGAVPPVYNAIQQKLLQDSVFSFWLNRDVGGNRGGELVLGGVDNTHFKGEHTWCAACPQTPGHIITKPALGKITVVRSSAQVMA